MSTNMYVSSFPIIKVEQTCPIFFALFQAICHRVSVLKDK